MYGLRLWPRFPRINNYIDCCRSAAFLFAPCDHHYLKKCATLPTQLCMCIVHICVHHNCNVGWILRMMTEVSPNISQLLKLIICWCGFFCWVAVYRWTRIAKPIGMIKQSNHLKEVHMYARKGEFFVIFSAVPVFDLLTHDRCDRPVFFILESKCKYLMRLRRHGLVSNWIGRISIWLHANNSLWLPLRCQNEISYTECSIEWMLDTFDRVCMCVCETNKFALRLCNILRWIPLSKACKLGRSMHAYPQIVCVCVCVHRLPCVWWRLCIVSAVCFNEFV